MHTLVIVLLIANIVLIGIMFFLFAEVIVLRHDLEDKLGDFKKTLEEQQKHTGRIYNRLGVFESFINKKP